MFGLSVILELKVKVIFLRERLTQSLRIFLKFFSLKNIKKESNFCYFHTLITLILMCSVPKRGPNFIITERPKIFMTVFIVLWPYLLTTKLRCLQKNNIGHTKLTVLIYTVTAALLHACNKKHPIALSAMQ